MTKTSIVSIFIVLFVLVIKVPSGVGRPIAAEVSEEEPYTEQSSPLDPLLKKKDSSKNEPREENSSEKILINHPENEMPKNNPTEDVQIKKDTDTEESSKKKIYNKENFNEEMARIKTQENETYIDEHLKEVPFEYEKIQTDLPKNEIREEKKSKEELVDTKISKGGWDNSGTHKEEDILKDELIREESYNKEISEKKSVNLEISQEELHTDETYKKKHIKEVSAKELINEEGYKERSTEKPHKEEEKYKELLYKDEQLTYKLVKDNLSMEYSLKEEIGNNNNFKDNLAKLETSHNGHSPKENLTKEKSSNLESSQKELPKEDLSKLNASRKELPYEVQIIKEEKNIENPTTIRTLKEELLNINESESDKEHPSKKEINYQKHSKEDPVKIKAHTENDIIKPVLPVAESNINGSLKDNLVEKISFKFELPQEDLLQANSLNDDLHKELPRESKLLEDKKHLENPTIIDIRKKELLQLQQTERELYTEHPERNNLNDNAVKIIQLEPNIVIQKEGSNTKELKQEDLNNKESNINVLREKSQKNEQYIEISQKEEMSNRKKAPAESNTTEKLEDHIKNSHARNNTGLTAIKEASNTSGTIFPNSGAVSSGNKGYGVVFYNTSSPKQSDAKVNTAINKSKGGSTYDLDIVDSDKIKTTNVGVAISDGKDEINISGIVSRLKDGTSGIGVVTSAGKGVSSNTKPFLSGENDSFSVSTVAASSTGKIESNAAAAVVIGGKDTHTTAGVTSGGKIGSSSDSVTTNSLGGKGINNAGPITQPGRSSGISSNKVSANKQVASTSGSISSEGTVTTVTIPKGNVSSGSTNIAVNSQVANAAAGVDSGGKTSNRVTAVTSSGRNIGDNFVAVAVNNQGASTVGAVSSGGKNSISTVRAAVSETKSTGSAAIVTANNGRNNGRNTTVAVSSGGKSEISTTSANKVQGKVGDTSATVTSSSSNKNKVSLSVTTNSGNKGATGVTTSERNFGGNFITSATISDDEGENIAADAIDARERAESAITKLLEQLFLEQRLALVLPLDFLVGKRKILA